MARFTIYSPTGTALYTGTPSFTGQYMKPGLLEFREVSVPTLLALEPGCYVDYDRTGYRYRIYTVPQIKKQARRATYGGAFVFQGVQLYDASKQLEYCPFRDLVKGDNRIHFSTQPSISTFEGVDGLARRFEACLRDQYDVEGVQSWAVRIATPERDGVDSALYEMMLEPREFTVSGMNILECLDKVYEIWPDVGWVYKVENGIDTIVIGGGGINANSGTYAYGKGRGLTSLTRVAANAEEIANRIFAYGSNQNMLPRWYNSQQIKDAESVDIQNLMLPVGQVGTYPGWGLTDDLPDAAKAFVENAASIAKNGLRPATVYFDGSGEYPAIYPSIRETTIGMVRTAIGDSTAKYYPSTAVYTNPNERVDVLESAQSVWDSGKAATNGKATLATDYADISKAGTGSVAPGSQHTEEIFSKSIVVTDSGLMNLNASIGLTGTMSVQAESVFLQVVFTVNGIRAAIQNFEMREVANGQWAFPSVSASGQQIAVSSGNSVGCIVLAIIANRGSDTASSYSYSTAGTYSFKMSLFRAKTFTVTVKQLGFDINEQAELGNGKTIAMRTGKCAGRSFAINSVQYDSTTDSWVLECWRTEDESLSQWFPNTDYPVRGLENAGQSNEYPGDEFVLLDIAMPAIYVQMAEQKLLTAAQELIADTAVERWQYSPEIDAKFMVENSRTINAGEYLLLSDTDIIGQAAESVLVDTVTINEGESAIPTYKVTLRDRKKKTWTESQSPDTPSNKSVGGMTTQQETPYVDLTGYVKRDEFNNLFDRVTALEDESFFMLDSSGNVTLKAAYQNLWVPGWLAAGGIGAGGGSGSATELGDLVDVALTTPDNGDLLVYNLATSHWENKPQSSIIPSVSIGFNDLTSHPTTIAGYGITDANIANGTITIGANTITPITTESDPTVPSWAKAQSKPSYSLSEISGADDLRAIEALAGTSGILKKTAANTWSLDTTAYLSAHQSVILASGTNNGTLKLTTAAGTTDNIAVKGLGALAYKSSLASADIPDISGTYVTLSGAQTITGAKTFSGNITMSGANLLTAVDSANQVGSVTNRFGYGFFRNLYTTYLGFRDGDDGETQWGRIGCGDGYMAIYLEDGNGSVDGQYVFNSDYGFFHGGNGDVPCGRSDHRWSYVYGIYADFSGGLSVGGDIVPATDLGSQLGYSGRRFSNLNVRTIGGVKEINFKDSNNSATTGYLSFANGWMILRSGADLDSSYKQITFHETYGLYPETAGVNLGYNGANYRWANIYGVNADLSGNIDVAGVVRVNTLNTIDQSNATMSLFNYGARATKSFNAYGTGINFRACDSNGDQVNILAINATKIQAGSDLIPSYTEGLNLGGSSANTRWATIYGVNANLSGNLSLSSASYIDIGPVRITYDFRNEAIHITTNDATNHPTIGFYADGFVAAGGVGQTS